MGRGVWRWKKLPFVLVRDLACLFLRSARMIHALASEGLAFAEIRDALYCMYDLQMAHVSLASEKEGLSGGRLTPVTFFAQDAVRAQAARPRLGL